MRLPYQIITLGFALAALFSVSCGDCLAQIPTSSDSPQTGVVLTKLVQPIYPPLARVTHTTGDVDLVLSIRQDGTVDSVVVASGHPLLKQAALTSVQQSRFECRKCTEPFTTYRLAYTFKLEGECECLPRDAKFSAKEEQHAYPQVTDAEHRVTIVVFIWCSCDPTTTITRRVRSFRCLYLWKCSTQVL